MRKLLYVIFCVGCMAALAWGTRQAFHAMSDDFLFGFIAGAIFVGAVVAACLWIERYEAKNGVIIEP